MMQVKFMMIILLSFFFTGCGGGGGDSSVPVTTPTTTTTTIGTITLSGKVTYDLVPVNSNGIGLDYTNIRSEAVKAVQVDAVGESNQILASTVTDNSGNYAFSVPNNTILKIRVSARMRQTTTPGWDVEVLDASNGNALHVMEGSLLLTGTSNETRDLHAPSGWDGNAYSSKRVAGPFAMLDTIYTSMQIVLATEPNILFPALDVFWYAGNIDGTYYTNGGLYIYGDENSDTDEYDKHVIAHEWAHYYEDKLSRSDSIGGQHAISDRLDIRVAFSEGFGNAFSGMALNNPLYSDTLGVNQANGFSFNMENDTTTNPGWYNESSVHKILYDLFDSTNDGADILSLGFAPLHNVFTKSQKTTPAFVSIFTFITALKSENAGGAVDIDAIVSSESIASITDIYGTGRTNLASELPNYSNLTIGGTANVCPSYTYGTGNKLGNHQFLKFSIGTAGTYTITVVKSNLSGTTDPDFLIYKDTSIVSGFSTLSDSETKILTLSIGDYLLDVSDYNNVVGACFDVTLN